MGNIDTANAYVLYGISFDTPQYADIEGLVDDELVGAESNGKAVVICSGDNTFTDLGESYAVAGVPVRLDRVVEDEGRGLNGRGLVSSISRDEFVDDAELRLLDDRKGFIEFDPDALVEAVSVAEDEWFEVGSDVRECVEEYVETHNYTDSVEVETDPSLFFVVNLAVDR